ncbi:MAG: hypothetical protein SGPRY_013225, partial [Prymnesium sp.]
MLALSLVVSSRASSCSPAQTARRPSESSRKPSHPSKERALPKLTMPFSRDRQPPHKHAKYQISEADARKIQELLSSSEWRHVATQSGITVYEQRLYGSDQIFVRAEGDLHAPVDAVLDVYRDSDVQVIRDYNPSYEDGYDLVSFDETNQRYKVSWAVSKSIFPVSAREFITEVRYVSMPNGGVAVLSEGLRSHKRAPKPRAHS